MLFYQEEMFQKSLFKIHACADTVVSSELCIKFYHETSDILLVFLLSTTGTFVFLLIFLLSTYFLFFVQLQLVH